MARSICRKHVENTIFAKDFDMNKLFCRIFVGFLPFYLQNPTKKKIIHIEILGKNCIFLMHSIDFDNQIFTDDVIINKLSMLQIL